MMLLVETSSTSSKKRPENRKLCLSFQEEILFLNSGNHLGSKNLYSFLFLHNSLL